jgi:hypothetical protein
MNVHYLVINVIICFFSHVFSECVFPQILADFLLESLLRKSAGKNIR